MGDWNDVIMEHCETFCMRKPSVIAKDTGLEGNHIEGVMSEVKRSNALRVVAF